MQPPFNSLRDELERVDDPPDMAFDALMDELEGPGLPTGLLAFNTLVDEQMRRTRREPSR